MTSNRGKIVAAVFALTICGACATRYVVAQQSSGPRQPPAVIEYHGDMAYMLANLTDIYGATIGLEVDPQQPKSQVGFFLRDPTLTDVLNAIVQSAPRYQWRESAEFIEVSPVERSCPLLDTIIVRFRVADADESEAINQLLKLTEVQASMRAMSLNCQDRGEASAEKKGEKFSISLENVTLRQALNSIARESGKRFWIFRTDRSGFFRSALLPDSSGRLNSFAALQFSAALDGVVRVTEARDCDPTHWYRSWQCRGRGALLPHDLFGGAGHHG